MKTIVCSICGTAFACRVGCYNRAKSLGYTPACSRACGVEQKKRRNPRQTPAPGSIEARTAKAEYDRAYRAANSERLLAAKRAAYFADPERLAKGAARRAATRGDPRAYAEARAKHNAHCSTPEYKARKAEYDSRYTARKRGGDDDMVDAVLALRALEGGIIEQMPTRQERESMRFAAGRRNQAQKRKRMAHGESE